jgi:hypothetical protein
MYLCAMSQLLLVRLSKKMAMTRAQKILEKSQLLNIQHQGVSLKLTVTIIIIIFQ